MGRLRLPDGTVRTFYRHSQGAVEDALAEALRTIDQGLPLPDARLTFGGWLREWLTGLQGLKPSTVDYYTRYVKVHLLRSAVAEKPLAKLDGRDLAQLYQHMTADAAQGGQGKSSTTARHLHAIVHRALADAVEEGKVARNAADLVPKRARPMVAHQEMRVLAGVDYDRFLEAVRGDRLEALFVVAIREGLRRGEILGLRWKDVDLDARTISVTGSLQGSRAANLAIGEPKTARSRRRLELFAETVVALREHRERQRFEARRAGSMWVDEGLVFTNEFGRHLGITVLTNRLDAILRGAELPDVRFHDLRHSAATDWLRGGMHPKVASERLGHASVGITLDLYSHVTPTMQREAVEEVRRRRSGRLDPGGA